VDRQWCAELWNLEWEVQGLQSFLQQSDDGQVQLSGVTEAWQEWCEGATGEDEGSASHTSSGASAAASCCDERSCDHVSSGEFSGGSGDGNQASAHGESGFVTAVTVNEQCASGHAADGPWQSSAGAISGVAVDANQSPPHFCCDPAADAAGDVDPATCESAAEVSSGGSFNADVSRLHSGANPVNAAEVPLEDQLLIGGIAGDVEEVPEWYLSVAFEDIDAGDFADRCAGTFLGGDPFQFNRD